VKIAGTSKNLHKAKRSGLLERRSKVRRPTKKGKDEKMGKREHESTEICRKRPQKKALTGKYPSLRNADEICSGSKRSKVGLRGANAGGAGQELGGV